MKLFTDFYTRIAIKLYPYRWPLVAAFFLPFFSWSPTSTGLMILAWVWSNLALFIVLTYGPIKHFEGSVIWSDGWRPLAWLFLLPVVFGVLAATVFIPYALILSIFHS